jgi:hypothetical protein
MFNSIKPSHLSTYKAVFIVVICFVFPFTSDGQSSSYDHELITMKAAARHKFATQIDEFNNYKNRPESDGPYNPTNNTAFLLDNAPLLFTSEDLIDKVYNYRWWMISKHLKQYDDPYDHKKYWVITEFFGVKPWASLSGAITCPAGQQFYDVRWLRDHTYLQSYADYFMKGSASKLNQRENGNFLTHMSRPESHHFSSWMINGIDAFLKVHPDDQWLHDELPYMEKHQEVWDSLFSVQASDSQTNGMYKILDLYDGMEFSLSAVLGLVESKGAYGLYTRDNWRNFYLGWGTDNNAAKSEQAKVYPKAFTKGYPDFYLVRPSLNSYMYGNLKSLSTLYQIDNRYRNGKAHQQQTSYAKKASALQQKVLDVLWNGDDNFFNTVSAGDNEFGIKDYHARVRESVGYTPWYFNLVPKKTFKRYEKGWKLFSSDKGFYSNSGMTTAEQQHPYYNEQAYAWNGRGWPFENSIVYKAYANYLRDYKKTSTIKEKELLLDHIEKLARLHGDKELNIGEWYIPSTGKTFGGEQDYFHSTFPDMIIEDLLGFKSSHKEEFTISPLLPEGHWKYFYLGNIKYHHHDIDLIWKEDWDDKKPGKQSKLCIWLDGKLAGTSSKLIQSLKVKLRN